MGIDLILPSAWSCLYVELSSHGNIIDVVFYKPCSVMSDYTAQILLEKQIFMYLEPSLLITMIVTCRLCMCSIDRPGPA